MRQENYDTWMDRAGIGAGLILVWLLGSAIMFGVLSLIMAGLNALIGINFSPPTLVIISIISGVPISTFVLLFAKASNKYHITYFRDFWMAFGHAVILKPKDDYYDQVDEMEEWCNQNCNHLFGNSNNTRTWVFLSKEDAMAFKLKWS